MESASQPFTPRPFQPYRTDPFVEPCAYCGADVPSEGIVHPETHETVAHSPHTRYWNERGPICLTCRDNPHWFPTIG